MSAYSRAILSINGNEHGAHSGAGIVASGVQDSAFEWPLSVGSADALVPGVDKDASVSGAIASRRCTRQWRNLHTLLACAASTAAILVAGVALAVALAARAEIAELRALAANGARQAEVSNWHEQLESFDFKVGTFLFSTTTTREIQYMYSYFVSYIVLVLCTFLSSPYVRNVIIVRYRCSIAFENINFNYD